MFTKKGEKLESIPTCSLEGGGEEDWSSEDSYEELSAELDSFLDFFERLEGFLVLEGRDLVALLFRLEDLATFLGLWGEESESGSCSLVSSAALSAEGTNSASEDPADSKPLNDTDFLTANSSSESEQPHHTQ